MQGIKRIRLKPGEQQAVRFALEPKQLATVNDAGQVRIEPGRRPDRRRRQTARLQGATNAETTQVVTAETEITGPAITFVS